MSKPIHLEVLFFMKMYLIENDNMPSLGEIANKFGWKSTKSAFEHLLVLEKRGYLEPVPGRRSKYRLKRNTEQICT